MEYAYTIEEDTLMVKVTRNEEIIDYSGPWESLSSASEWAESIVHELNAAMCILE